MKCLAYFAPPELRSWRSVLVAFFVLATSGLLVAEASKPNSLPCALTKAEAAGLSVDAGTDIKAIPTYKKTIYGLLKAGKFEPLDFLADSARIHKETFPGKAWKLHTIYDAVGKPPLQPTGEDWAAHISLLRRWTAVRLTSITARVALAQAYLYNGWDARGDGYADSVSRSGWKLFEQRAAQASEELKQASHLQDKCPEWYVGGTECPRVARDPEKEVRLIGSRRDN